MELRLLEFDAMEQLGEAREEEALISIPFPVVAKARMQGLSRTLMAATAVVTIVTLGRNSDASNPGWLCCKVTAMAFLTTLSW